MPICSLLKWQRFLLKVISHKYGVFLFFFTVSDNECEGCVGEPLCTYVWADWLVDRKSNKQRNVAGRPRYPFETSPCQPLSNEKLCAYAQMGKRNPTPVLLLNYVNTVLNRCLKPLKRTEYCKWTLLMWFSHNSEGFVLLEVQRLISEYVKCPS